MRDFEESEKPIFRFHGEPQLGGTMQTLYEVEWIAKVPEDENGDADIDNG